MADTKARGRTSPAAREDTATVSASSMAARNDACGACDQNVESSAIAGMSHNTGARISSMQ